jgi:succinate dehydrogenase flavin-adding protein (antitoxin of CptAB toxin-antitoxin module)
MKGNLVKDERFDKLNKLAQIDLLPRSRLSALQNKLGSLRTCFNLVKEDLENSPICPHCSFRPAEEELDAPASNILETIDREIDTILDEWEQTLLNNLREPMVQQDIALLNDEERNLIEEILEKGKLPEKISDRLITVLSQVFSGLDKVEIKNLEIINDLVSGGMPCTVNEYRKRFEEHLTKLIEGKDRSKIRILIKEENSYE